MDSTGESNAQDDGCPQMIERYKKETSRGRENDQSEWLFDVFICVKKVHNSVELINLGKPTKKDND